jgi:hypothetical protein
MSHTRTRKGGLTYLHAKGRRTSRTFGTVDNTVHDGSEWEVGLRVVALTQIFHSERERERERNTDGCVQHSTRRPDRASYTAEPSVVRNPNLGLAISFWFAFYYLFLRLFE